MRSALQFKVYGDNIVEIEALAEKAIQRFLAVDSGTDVSELADIEVHAEPNDSVVVPQTEFIATVSVRIR